MKNTLFVKTTASPITTTKTCSSPACIYHIILLGESEELLQKLDTFCFTYQHVDCLYTLFKYHLNGKNFAMEKKRLLRKKFKQHFMSALQKNKSTQTSGSVFAMEKKRLLRKKFKQHFMSALQKNKSTQTSGSVFAERIEKAKQIKVELEVIKVVDCFLDGLGNFDSNLVLLKKIFIKNTIFCYS